PAEKEKLRRIYDVRDKYARKHNMPPHNIVHNANLINIVTGEQKIDELRLPRRFSQELVRDILQDLENAVGLPAHGKT
ncbi:MAG: HRDC domain-containing protein, partial [Chloroflexota bacterium]